MKSEKEEGDQGEDSKNYPLHFQNCQLLHPILALQNLFSKICNDCPCKSHRAEKFKSGGSDPTFLRTIRPKVSWGHSRPRRQCASTFARLHVWTQGFVRQNV